MTKHAKTTAAKATEARTATVEATEAQTAEARTLIMDALESVQEKIAVPAAAREFVAHQAATAQERAEAVHEGAASLNAHVEKAGVSLIASYASFTRGLIDMTAANVNEALATVEKLAAAKSLPDAMQIQSAYVRDSATANFERVRTTIETARDSLAEATAAARDTATTARGNGSKAA